ncbi:MAG TPA: PRC-barrel domain-containing protein [Rhodothermales bacterium]|nr:PRC-barrel domain-containing protein [Rhodothermales bacterium]
MARIMLRKDDPWLSATRPDIRGWLVKDRDGNSLGRVEDVYVDDKSGRVDSVVVASGRVIPPDHFDVHEDYLTTDVSVQDDLPRTEHTEPIRPTAGSPPPGSFAARYRTHFDLVYGGKGAATFEDFFLAYHFGRVQALDARLFGDSFLQAEQDLRALYELRFPGRSFEDAREAVRYGFNLGAALRASEPMALPQEGDASAEYALDREQHRPSDEEPSTEQAARTSASMSTGDARE